MSSFRAIRGEKIAGFVIATITAAGIAATVGYARTPVQTLQQSGASPRQPGEVVPPPQTAPPTPKPLLVQRTPTRECGTLKAVSLPDTTIESAAVDPGSDSVPASCRVTATTTHPPAGDKIKIWIALPMKDWNGRFQGIGGGGFSGGSANGVVQPLRAGYAAGSTDTGHDGGSGNFALGRNGHLDWQLIRDNAYLGVHEMTVTGKALAEAFYGAAPAKAYWNGCSTGGRQGLSEAQRYPADYDGILAGAPAINWTKLHVEQMWGTVVMLELNHVIAPCKYASATQAAIAACDRDDGVADGIINDPRTCKFDPATLVGTNTECGAFSTNDAAVVRAIWEGPRRRDGSFLWYGLTRGADFNGLSGTGGTPPAPRPNNITVEWWKYFLNEDPQWSPLTLTRAAYEQYWDKSVEQFSAVLATDNPDLSAFKARGGKIITWHGEADPLIYPDGTIDYYTRVQKAMGGADKTSDFYRLFLAPGVGHCGGGSGPAPSGQFEAVVKWVEEGVAPATLDAVRRDQAGVVTRSRILCPYPAIAQYQGSGSTDAATSFACRTSR
jgi:feruloyl esterase